MSSLPQVPPAGPRYAGFWVRVKASLVDIAWQVPLVLGLGFIFLGRAYFTGGSGARYQTIDFLISYGVPAMVTIAFWFRYQATPGKLLCNLRVVDARTLQRPRGWQWFLRYLGYIPSTMFFGLGLLWVAFDRRRQGWHDKIARTVVVHSGADGMARTALVDSAAVGTNADIERNTGRA